MVGVLAASAVAPSSTDSSRAATKTNRPRRRRWHMRVSQSRRAAFGSVCTLTCATEACRCRSALVEGRGLVHRLTARLLALDEVLRLLLGGLDPAPAGL